MLYGLDKKGKRIEAEPQKKAKCPTCNTELISKCGSINIWHWAHKNSEECDSWSEGETQWHLGWKQIIKPEFCEMKIGNHRADIKTNFGTIIELQNSSIDSYQIKEREKFYNNMIWIFNGKQFENNFIIKNNYIECNKFDKGAIKKSLNDYEYFVKYNPKTYRTFRWKHPRKYLWYVNKPLFIDFGLYLLEIKKIYPNTPCGGWGHLITRTNFIKKYMENIIKDGILQ